MNEDVTVDGFTVQLTDNHARVLRFVDEFGGGVPLSCSDVGDELELDHIYSHKLLSDLAFVSRVSLCRGPGGTWLFYVGRKT